MEGPHGTEEGICTIVGHGDGNYTHYIRYPNEPQMCRIELEVLTDEEMFSLIILEDLNEINLLKI
jgi:hypothetical protein